MKKNASIRIFFMVIGLFAFFLHLSNMLVEISNHTLDVDSKYFMIFCMVFSLTTFGIGVSNIFESPKKVKRKVESKDLQEK